MYAWESWEKKAEAYLTDDNVRTVYHEDKLIRYGILDSLQKAF